METGPEGARECEALRLWGQVVRVPVPSLASLSVSASQASHLTLLSLAIVLNLPGWRKGLTALCCYRLLRLICIFQ